jgi:deoxyribonuclease-4
MRRVGVHTSIAGGLHRSLERAQALGCNTLQIFSHNPRGWTLTERDPEETRAFRELKKQYDISPVFIHTAKERSLVRKSIDMVVNEMKIADKIGADYVVLHTGSASGEDPGVARKRATACLAEVSERGKWRTGLLLENTAGERGDITSKIETGIAVSYRGQVYLVDIMD